jgi:2-methylcitrate dehydratase PrpD
LSRSSGRDAVPFTQSLVAAALAIGAAPLADDVIGRTLDLVVDHVGVALRGAREACASRVRDEVLGEGAAPVATLAGGGRTSVRGAALHNGTAAHSLEFDDTHDASLTHPGAAVIPAALAVAEARGAGGGDTLRAIVAGYQTMTAIGRRIGQPLIERGVHPTASLGVFGAATASGLLMRLDAAALSSAFGLGASMSAGSMQFAHDPDGTMVKRLFGGLPAERGVLAAALAARGVSGPGAAIEGEFGIANVLARTAIERMDDAREAGLAVMDMSIKLYSCCRNFHALIDAIAQCRSRRAASAQDIAGVEVRGPRAMIDHHLERRPRSTMAAQYSLPFTTAVALLSDPADPASFAGAELERADLRALADRVEPVHDDAFQRLFPRHFGGGVAIRYADGSLDEVRVVDSRGTPGRPATGADIRAKFDALTGPLLSPAQRARLLDAIAGLPCAPSLDRLASALAC